MFLFFYLDVNYRKNFIDVIFNELIIKLEIGFEFVIYVILILCILSCDKDGLGLFFLEKLIFILLFFVEILLEESKDIGNICFIDVGNWISDDRSEVLD